MEGSKRGVMEEGEGRKGVRSEVLKGERGGRERRKEESV